MHSTNMLIFLQISKSYLLGPIILFNHVVMYIILTKHLGVEMKKYDSQVLGDGSLALVGKAKWKVDQTRKPVKSPELERIWVII